MAKATYKRRGTTKRRRTLRAKISVPRFRKLTYNMQEKKYLDYKVTGLACNTSGMCQSLLYGTSILWGGGSTVAPDPAGLSQGTSASTRIGNKIYLHSITVTMNIFGTAAAAGAALGCAMRWGIYHNKECNGVQLTWAQIFNDAQAFANRSIPYKPKVTLLKDRVDSIVVTGTDSTGAVKTVGPNTLHKCAVYPKKVISYSSGTSTIADILKDDYGLYMICQASSTMNMNFAVQIIYSDL